jgi:hypothetical protein
LKQLHWVPACVGLSLLGLPALSQEVGKDIKPDHWAYAAVQDLAGKGLIKGYPADGKFLGARTLSRYEMATIIERVINRMDDLLSKKAAPSGDDTKADKADLEKLKASVGEIRDLVEEFKKELLVIGSDLKTAQDDITTLKQQVAQLTDKVNGFDQRINDVDKKATDAKALGDTALANIEELKKQTTDDLGHKIDVANGRLRIGGVFQTWFGTAFGNTLNGNNPTNYSSPPPGRSFGGGVGDTFRLRRFEFFFTGQLMPELANKPGGVDYFLLLDTAKTISNSNSGGVATAQPNSTFLQDAFIGLQLSKRVRLEAGQQKTDMSEEGSRSSAALLTIERSIMNGLPVTAGRIGYVRDTGAMLRFSNRFGKAMVGVFNGNGDAQTTVDGDRSKFAVFNAYFTGFRHFTLGAWGGNNFGDSHPAAGRERLGYTFIYQNGPHYFESEGANARDYAAGNGKPGQGADSRGAYAMYGYSFARKWQVVGRYDIWDPAYLAGQFGTPQTTLVGFGSPIARTAHDLREYTVGLNYYWYGRKGDGSFDQRAKLQFNFIWEDPEANAVAFFGTRRQILLTNLQAAF